jgi:hypothetical protein
MASSWEEPTSDALDPQQTELAKESNVIALSCDQAPSQDSLDRDKEERSSKSQEKQTSKKQKPILDQLIDPKTKSTKQLLTEFFRKIRQRSSQPKSSFNP